MKTRLARPARYGWQVLGAVMRLTGGGVTLALWLWWLRFGREVAEELGQASMAPRGRRTRERIEALPEGTVGFWYWLPFVLSCRYLEELWCSAGSSPSSANRASRPPRSHRIPTPLMGQALR